MKTTYLGLKYYVTILGLLLLGACGTISLNSNIDASLLSKKYENQSVTQVIESLTLRMSKAQGEHLERYSPGLYNKAKQTFSDAQSAYRGKASVRRVLTLAYTAEKSLDEAIKVKQLAIQHLRDVFDAIALLEAKKVATSHMLQFNTLLAKAADLVEFLEQRVTTGKLMDVVARQRFDQERKVLLENIGDLTIKVVKFNMLESTLVMLDGFIEDAKELAPQTYALVEKAKQAAEVIIDNNVDDEAAVRKASENFRFSVNHALHVTQAVRQLHALPKKHYEDYVLDLERKLIPINNALENRDIRDRNFYEQTIVLTKAASKLMHEKNKLKKQKTVLSKTGISKEEKVNTAVDIVVLQQEKSKSQEEKKKLTQKIETLQFVIKGLKRNERPLKDKIWLLEQQVNELGTENRRLNERKRELESKLGKL